MLLFVSQVSVSIHAVFSLYRLSVCLRPCPMCLCPRFISSSVWISVSGFSSMCNFQTMSPFHTLPPPSFAQEFCSPWKRKRDAEAERQFQAAVSRARRRAEAAAEVEGDVLTGPQIEHFGDNESQHGIKVGLHLSPASSFRAKTGRRLLEYMACVLSYSIF